MTSRSSVVTSEAGEDIAVLSQPSTSRVVWLALPASGISLLAVLLEVYLLKFSTDVLLLGPAVMGTLIGLVRWFDVINGPVIGHLSDRTESATGRQKSWMLYCALPCAVAFWLLWNLPEEQLSRSGMVVWLVGLLLVFQVFHAGVSVPFLSLGAETAKSYQGKNRYFAVVQVFLGIGSALAIGAMGFVTSASESREAIAWVSSACALYFVATIYLSVPGATAPVAEKSRPLGLRSSLGHVLRNPHARSLFAAQIAFHLGTTLIFVGIPYYAEYVVGRGELAGPILGVAFIASIVALPLWGMLLKRMSKARVFAIGMLVRGATALCFIPMTAETGAGWFLALAAIFGASGGGPMIAGPSMVGDVADYDESVTGERKEGFYFAVSKALRRFAGGLAVLLVGYGLALSGFAPNTEQAEEVSFAVRFMIPGLCGIVGVLGAWGLRSHGLGQQEHEAIVAQLRRRAGPVTGSERNDGE